MLVLACFSHVVAYVLTLLHYYAKFGWCVHAAIVEVIDALDFVGARRGATRQTQEGC